MIGDTQTQSPQELDHDRLDPFWSTFHKNLQILIKRRWLVAGTFVVILGLTAVWTFSRTRIYRATATVLIDNQAPRVLGEQVREVVDLSSGNIWRNQEYMHTQEKVILSNGLAEAVVERLHLVASDAFWGGPTVAGASAAKAKQRTLERARSRLRSMISVQTIKSSNIIEIAVEHANSDMASRLVNAVVQTYMDRNLEYKLSSTTGAVKWLANQLDDLKEQLEGAEMALYQFKKDNNIVSVSLEERQTLVSRQIEKLSDSLTGIRIRRIELEAKRRQLEKMRGQDPLKLALKEITEDPTSQELKRRYVEEYRTYAGLRERYLERHPQVLEQKAKVEASLGDLKRQIEQVVAAIQTEHQQIVDQETQLSAALQQAKDHALDLNKREVSYQRLTRTRENTARLYSLVLTRMKESDLSSQLRFNNMRVLDKATVPKEPVRPKVPLMLLIGSILGMMFGVGLAFGVEFLDSTVKSQEDVTQIPGLVYLGLMPRIPGSLTNKKGRRPDPRPDLDLIVHRNPKSPVAESCRAIRTNLLFSSPDRPMGRLLVSSAGPREGKTTTTTSLAITMAQAGSKVLVVDTDMRRPRMHKVFGVPGAEGITSVLLGDARIEDMIKSTEIPGLFVLPCGPTPPNPAEICQSDRFRALLDELSDRFDRVILDSPPVMVVTDAVVLSTLADGTLLVGRTGETNRVSLREATKQLLDVGANLLGCVLNDMDLQKKKYGYYRYRRYGYERYGGHYGEQEGEAAG